MANASKKIVQPKDLPKRATHSQVVTVTGGTLVFIAGMTSRSEKDAAPVHAGNMHAQVRQVCENLGRALRSGSLIGVKRLAHPDLMVEIEAMAVVPADRFKPVD